MSRCSSSSDGMLSSASRGCSLDGLLLNTTKQETVSGSGISWAICKSAPRSRQITMPAPHQSVFLQAGCPSCRPTNSVKALKTNKKTNTTNTHVCNTELSLIQFNAVQQQHVALRVCSAVQRHQSAEKPILHQISSLMYHKIQQRQVIINVLHPGCAWPPPVLNVKPFWFTYLLFSNNT